MRGRPPQLIELSTEDVAYLEQLLRDGRTEQRVARRAWILLAMADPATVVQDVAERLGVARTTIWNLCRTRSIFVQPERRAAKVVRYFNPLSSFDKKCKVFSFHPSGIREHWMNPIIAIDDQRPMIKASTRTWPANERIWSF